MSFFRDRGLKMVLVLGVWEEEGKHTVIIRYPHRDIRVDFGCCDMYGF